MKRLIAFPYYGGKNSHLTWLLPLLPYDIRFVEPFGGSAAVLLNRERSPVEVYNDINGDVVNFFRILRERHEELRDLLYLTPYSKEAFHYSHEPTDDPLERARRWFTHARQSYMGTTRTWATGLQIRSGYSQMCNRWLGGIEKLEQVVTRFLNVHIENRSAEYVIKAYDDPETVMYLDPPYMHEARQTKEGYEHEMSFKDHKSLLRLIKSCESKIAISGYHNKLYDLELKDWYLFEDEEKSLAGPRGSRQEILWTNYDYTEVRSPQQTALTEFE